MRFIGKFIRTLINVFDFFLLKLWLLRVEIGYKLWGADYRVRQISRAPSRYLGTILKHLGAVVQGTVTLKGGLTLDNIELGLKGLHIEDRAYIGPGVFLDLAASISIETEAVLASQVMLLTHGDVGKRMLSKVMPRKEGPITLKAGCWIGARAVILPDITVGKGAIVGAGAVVTEDIPDYTVVAGVPARQIRKLVP
jgi:acetyltransferase-like isoleucine patch superfamily enzyme